MSGIVCAIRGGPESSPTIEKSIALAQETKSKIYFLYVVNLDFLHGPVHSRVSTISEEMHQMGEFILLTAQEKAGGLGVEAEGVIRKGVVTDEIIELSKEVDANFVVLGRPRTDAEDNVFVMERLLELRQRIENEGEVKVVLAERLEDE